MNRKVINFVRTVSGTYRSIIKTRHGRQLFLEVTKGDQSLEIVCCFYIDRNRGKSGAQRQKAVPLKLKTTRFFSENEFLSVLQTELDTLACTMKFDESFQTEAMNVEQFIGYHEKQDGVKYHFLILVGSGENIADGLPSVLRTRLKNQLHRSVFLELERYKHGTGIVKSCFYDDRIYQNPNHKVAPSGLFSCFFQYTTDGILNLVNNELNCNFNHVLIVSEDSVDIENDMRPICGAF